MSSFIAVRLAFLLGLVVSSTDASCVDNVTCENRVLSIHCPYGQYIDVQYALYGRDRGPDVCPSSAISITDGCKASSSLSRVWNTCQGRRNCAITASNSVFGDPCRGTYKFLRVEYECGNYLRVRSCEHSTVHLSCPYGQRITVLEAAYGRNAGGEVCPSGSLKQISNCRASTSYTIVRGRCDGRNSCAVSATNGVFGDPCVGTFKYLEVKYRCY